MLTKKQTDSLLAVLSEDVTRALSMKVPKFPRPYYCSYLLRDTDWFLTWANDGSLQRTRTDKARTVFCDLRVGNYGFDQTTNGGLFDNDDEIESEEHVSIPIDDQSYRGTRVRLWKLTEAKFREALTSYNSKLSSQLSTVDPNQKLPSFTKVKVYKNFPNKRRESVDQEQWQKFCKHTSSWLGKLPSIIASQVEFEATQETRVFVSTEGAQIVEHQQIFTLHAIFRTLTEKGEQLAQEHVIHVNSQAELPNEKVFKAELNKKYRQLLKLTHAEKIHAFSGPVLLYPIPAGLLFHEAIGHRLEGNRLLSSGEGQTFKGQLNNKILDAGLTIRDNPRLTSFEGTSCIGSYQFDDEGVPASNTLLIENGVLKGFLSTRAGLTKTHQSNGHARNKRGQRPISRMGVTIVEGTAPVSLLELKDNLIEEIKRQQKPFGMIVYETAGGETDTTSYDFQAFFGEISYATLLYPDGKEVPVKGVNFVGTPLQALGNIIGISQERELDNAYCGAESGFIPVSTISPAVLLSNLELQAKEDCLVTQYILPPPE